MANICSNTMTISGNKLQVQDLRNRLNIQDKDLLDACSHLEKTGGKIAYGLETDLPLPECDSITLYISSKWGPPIDDFEGLVKMYPGLIIEVVYNEPGNLVYGKVIYSEGEKVEDTRYSEEEYLDLYDEEFNDEVENIEDTDYEEFKETYINSDDYYEEYIWERAGYILEPKLIARTKTEDLPLLMGRLRWAEEPYKERLAAGV